MKLQLKNVHFSERLSQETNAFAADIFYNGKKIGYAENNGHGGCTNVGCYPESRDEFKEAAQYAKDLPKIVYEGSRGMKGFELDSNLEAQVDHLFENWLEQKEITKTSNKGLYYEQPDGQRYVATWKGHTIAKLKKNPNGIEAIKIRAKKLQLEGNIILNNNLEGIL